MEVKYGSACHHHEATGWGVSETSGAKHKPSIRYGKHNYSYIQWQRSLHMYRTFVHTYTDSDKSNNLVAREKFVRSWDWATYRKCV